MWDLAEDKNSIKRSESFVAAGKLVALVRVALRSVTITDDRRP
jgi:hypothetical protein